MKWFIIITVILCSCTVTSRIGIQEDKMFVTRKYVGQYVEYRFVKVRFIDPNICWIKTSLDSIYGKIPVHGKSIKYQAGEYLYLRRVYFNLPGNSGGFWTYLIESNNSRYIYYTLGNKGGTVMHEDLFNINN